MASASRALCMPMRFQCLHTPRCASCLRHWRCRSGDCGLSVESSRPLVHVAPGDGARLARRPDRVVIRLEHVQRRRCRAGGRRGRRRFRRRGRRRERRGDREAPRHALEVVRVVDDAHVVVKARPFCLISLGAQGERAGRGRPEARKWREGEVEAESLLLEPKRIEPKRIEAAVASLL